MASTNSLVAVTQALVDKFEANKVALGLQDVFFGDQERIPRSPALAIEPGDKTQEMQGAPRYTLVTHRILLLLYHSQIQDMQITRKEADESAEAVEALLHQDPQLGGLVIHGLVTLFESGYAYRSGTNFRSVRMTYTATCKVQLPF